MTVYEVFLEFLSVYFWVFIVLFVLYTICSYSDEYKEAKTNMIKYGRYKGMTIESLICWTLFFLSIKLTF